ncbi:putative DNA-binding protein [Alkalibaculum sp. M08DMB]|uniref:UPF0122 protein GC105_09665 n=1 Tax=Alkalibaculum sporogenes TaxID=2655001 RepID=A0A6A7KA48_9FIRM|nr:putative DNA-binding protein [Alkalibaculum sporogenes]MPW26057.1 putative DNA-binding protein [Alkalibaculum sporogenes]
MEKFIEISILYDFYGELLSEKQKLIVDYYYNNNFSLGEIAEKVSISRQGVYDSLKRSEELLHEYDSKLKLMDKYQINQELISNALDKLSNHIKNQGMDTDREILLDVENDLKKTLKQL